NAIVGMTTLLLDTEQTAEQRDFAETIRTSSDSLLTIINDILDFSKIEADKIEIERIPLDLRACVESAIDLLAARAADKSLDLGYVIQPEVPAAILGDVTRLRQILVNLLSNAVKFTERGEVVLTVAAEPLQPGQSLQQGECLLHFSVKDTGLGIAPEQMDRLFRSFSQVDASTTRRYGGTGLGLAISKRLAELMGGTMWVESEGLGRGATFHVTIRVETCDQPTATPPRDVPPQLRGKKMLVVDDNATNRLILTMQARAWGMDFRETASPREALAWIREGQHFDVGVLDMQMPDLDGIALAAEIRKLRDAQALPLVMLTSLGQRSGDTGAFAALLTKPLKPSQLLDALMTALTHQRVPVEVTRPTTEQAFDPTMGQRLPLRILLAEDNLTNQKVAVQLLGRMGYQADLAANGREALEATEQREYDVVLMDMQMPEMDGLAATRQIRARRGSSRPPYIVAMTANAMQGDREACLAAGMNDYVSKPILPAALAEALERGATAARQHARSSQDGQNSQPAHTAAGANGQTSIPDQAIPAQAILDQTALDNLRAMGAGDPQFLSELIATFLEDAPRLLAQLRQAVESGDAATVRLVAHGLKSNGAEFGAATFSDLCKTLETKSRAADLDGAAPLLAQIEAAYAQVSTALTAIR
ncbi:MAG TPA: response regulator, partial [Chloroflexota bacterium]|nr:response regulator [Chloroflexota bacterium]